MSEERSIRIVVREKGSFWIANEEQIFIVIIIFMILTSIGLIFSPFYSWIKGYSFYYLYHTEIVSIDGVGSGRIYYTENGQLKQKLFTCPWMPAFSVVNVALGFAYLCISIKAITGRSQDKENRSYLYSVLSRYMFVLAVAGIGEGFIFLLIYRNLPIYGLSGAQKVMDIPFYLENIGLQSISIGPSLGIATTIFAGVLSVFIGIIFTILSAEISKKSE